MLKGQLALVTGATAGIGLATARQLAEKGCDLILTGRRLDRLEKICADLRNEFKISAEALKFDISKRSECEDALNSPRAGALLSKLSILINNAGLALGTEPVTSAKLDDWDRMIDTNIKGLLYVTRLCLPHLVKNEGHLVNLGSVAGRWTYPGGAVYAATKFAVRALTEGTRLDLLGKPVRVTNIEPGMVETEFSEVRYDGDKEKAANVYKNMTPLTPDDIAETIVWCLDRPKHVNIQELVIYPTDQAGVGPYIHRRHS